MQGIEIIAGGPAAAPRHLRQQEAAVCARHQVCSVAPDLELILADDRPHGGQHGNLATPLLPPACCNRSSQTRSSSTRSGCNSTVFISASLMILNRLMVAVGFKAA